MGRAPLRVDIMMSIPGIGFDEAWENREVVELGDLKIFSFHDLTLFDQRKRVEDRKI